MADIVLSFGEETDLELTAVDIGRADAEDDGVLAFTVEGVIRGLDADLIETLVGQTVVPTEIHFQTEDD